MKKEKYNWQRSKEDIEKYWTDLVSKNLVGKTITKVEYVDDEEVEDNMWYKKPIAIQLDGKHWLIPMSDDEGNNAGALCHLGGECETIPVMRDR
mgnify:CR=1 FL=1